MLLVIDTVAVETSLRSSRSCLPEELVSVASRLRGLSLFEVSLGLLVLLDGLGRLTIWPDSMSLSNVVNVLQLCLYALLAIGIVRSGYSVKTHVAIGLSAVIFLAGWVQTHDSVFIRDVLLIVAASGAPFERTIRSMRYSLSAVLATGIITAACGLVPMESFRRGGLALGFGHPNQLALVLTTICLMWLAERRYSLRWKDIFTASLWTIVTFIVTQSRTPIMLMIVVIAVGIVQLRNGRRRVGRIVTLIAVLLPMACLSFTYLTAMVLPYNAFVNQLDLVLTNRIWLNWYAFTHHGIALFGQLVDLTADSGTVFNELRGTGHNSITVDNTYALSLLILGLLPTLCYICWNTFCLKRVADSGDFFILVLGIVYCLYGLTEAQMMDVFNNFVLLGAYSLGVNRSCDGTLVKSELESNCE